MVTIQQYLRGARRTKTFRSKTPAFHGCPQKRGVCLRVDIIKPKKPNSAKRRVAKVRLSNLREVMAYIPGLGADVTKNAALFVRGGRVPDLPGVRYHIFRQKLDFVMSEFIARSARRSKYGVRLTRPTPKGSTDLDSVSTSASPVIKSAEDEAFDLE